MMTPPSFTQVGRTLRVLTLLAEQPRSAPEVAGVLQVADQTARRLLKRLVVDGYAEELGTTWRRYRLGPTSFALGLKLTRVAVERASVASLRTADFEATGRVRVLSLGRSSIALRYRLPR